MSWVRRKDHELAKQRRELSVQGIDWCSGHGFQLGLWGCGSLHQTNRLIYLEGLALHGRSGLQVL